jgi:hypothetical protein
MSVQLNSQVSYIIDGFELNAGERVFLKDAVFKIIDGSEVGTAGLRVFLKDHFLRSIDGGPRASDVDDRVYISSHYPFIITGRASGERVQLNPHAFVLTGRPNPEFSALVSTSAFIIEVE